MTDMTRQDIHENKPDKRKKTSRHEDRDRKKQHINGPKVNRTTVNHELVVDETHMPDDTSNAIYINITENRYQYFT